MLKGTECWDVFAIGDTTDYWQGYDTVNSSIVAGQGRCDTAAFLNTAAIGNGAWIGVTTTVSSGYSGHAYKPTGIVQAIIVLEINNAAGDILMFVRVLMNGGVDVWKGPNTVLGTLLATSAAGLFSQDHYGHLGVEWNFSAGAGYARLHVNGLQVATFSGDTSNIWTSGQWAQLYYRATGYMDDHYWGDTVGPAPWNAFLGDCRVEGQVVLTDAVGGGGFYQEWTPSAGSDHGALVDEIPPDNGTTYLQSGTPGQRESFKFPDIVPVSGAVYAVQLMPNMVKTVTGGRTVQNLVRSGGADALGAASGVALTTYRYYPVGPLAGNAPFQVNPVTGLAWTAPTVNAMEGGVQAG